MDESVNNNGALVDRIQQLERERDELRKDIEQLCLQQSGPSYIAVATRMHFQRTAGLEQEIENLKKKLAVCTRNNQNLHEELSEVYHIKSQLADLHNVEVSKNLEAEKQLKFFQGCVAAAFAERDNALMEAEKAKEREDFILQELNTYRERVEETSSNFLEEKALHASLKIELAKLKEQNENFQKVITKFYDIRESCSSFSEAMGLDDKCECLVQDAPEMWSYNSNLENSTSEYIAALEKELETLRNTLDRHQNKMRVGLEIEDHLKQKVRKLEKVKILFDDAIKNKVSELCYSHTQHKCEVMNLLEREKTQFKEMLDMLHEKIKQLFENQTRSFEHRHGDAGIVDVECRDVHIATDAEANLVDKEKVLAPPTIIPEGTGDTSDAFAQALREKVSALLLLSQQDERYLLESNVNAALQRRMEELQRNLLQVTNEKVKALMELAQLRQDYQQLQENISHGIHQEPSLADKSITDYEKEGKLKNMFKKTYLSRWITRPEFGADYTEANKKSYSLVEFARMKIENATLKESIGSMENLTSSVHRLRRSLLKAKESLDTSKIVGLNDVIMEAKLVKTALGSSLPVSWSGDDGGTPVGEKLDFVSAAGFEMVELLILAAETFKDEN